MIFHVGRLVGKKLEPAFSISSVQGGGIAFSDVTNLADSERHLIMAHYGRPIRSKVVHEGAQFMRRFQPGSVHHFEHASYVLPHPFALLPAT